MAVKIKYLRKEVIKVNVWIFLLAIGLLFFSILVLGLLIARRTINKLAEDLNYARHTFVVWFITPVFRFYFWFLEALGKLRINVSGSIPWNEERLIFAGNHPMPKLQDTFLVPIIIFYLQFKHYLNPIRYFPVTTADETNFGKSPFFAVFGKTFIVAVDRSLIRIKGRSLEEIKKRSEECGGGLSIFFSEGGRTTSAEKNKKELRESLEGNKLATPLEKGAAKLSFDTDAPVVLFWSSISGDDPPAKPNPLTVLRGLIELLLNPRTKLILDFGHPNGPLRPKTGEGLGEFNQRIEDALLELGDYQTKRSRKGKR